MTIDPGKVIERSVDSLQRIYAVVIALAISQSIQSLLKGPTGAAGIDLNQLHTGLPGITAFVVTLVPFWHGMNRHLDRCYLEKTSTVIQGALLLDFVAFFIESIFLFAAGWSLASGIKTFEYLGMLLAVDMLLGIISNHVKFPGKKSHAVKWSLINLVAIALAVLVVTFPFNAKPLVLMMIAVLRSIADYALCWNFYFPALTTSEAGS
jgi:hypothetical protein